MSKVKVLVVVCLVALLFTTVVPIASAAPPSPSRAQNWVDNAKKKVWGTNGSDGAAAGAARRAGENGLSLPSAPSKPLGMAYRVVERAMKNNSRSR